MSEDEFAWVNMKKSGVMSKTKLFNIFDHRPGLKEMFLWRPNRLCSDWSRDKDVHCLRLGEI